MRTMIFPDFAEAKTPPLTVYGDITALAAYLEIFQRNGAVFNDARLRLLQYVQSLPDLNPDQDERFPDVTIRPKIVLSHGPGAGDTPDAMGQIENLRAWIDVLHKSRMLILHF